MMKKKKHGNYKEYLITQFTGIILHGITFMVTLWTGAYLGTAIFLIGYWFLVWGK